jgi:quercetin dioxygenase-like cupin family protein
LKITKDIISELLSRKDCAVLKDGGHEWRSSNSTVLSTPVVELLGMFASENLELGASIVRISGESGEPLHFHSSHLVGLVIRGQGWLCLPGFVNNASVGEADVRRVAVQLGDVAVIPRGALHLFECAHSSELDYLAVEFSDRPIDYQKHWSNAGAERTRVPISKVDP